jgi:hypothetical protein
LVIRVSKREKFSLEDILDMFLVAVVKRKMG